MSAPILVTVAAIGVGWAAIVKARNDAPQAPTGTTPDVPAAPTPSTKPVGLNVANTSALRDGLAAAPNAVVYGDPGVVGATQPIDQQPEGEGGFRLPSSSTQTDTSGSDSAPDPSTAPSVGGPEPSVQPSGPVTTAGLSTTSTDSPPPPQSLDTTTIYYGTRDGLTRTQIAQAMTEVGTKVGMVW